MTNLKYRNCCWLFAVAVAACAFVQFIWMPEARAGQIMVNTFADEFNLVGESSATCSLREAIKLANGDSTNRGCAIESGGSVVIDEYTYSHVINMPVGDYALNHARTCLVAYEDETKNGDLDIRSSVIIRGRWGSEPVEKDGSDTGETIISSSCVLTGADTNPDRIFHLKPASDTINVRFENLKITGGKINDKGGGIYAEDFVNLALSGVEVSGNHAMEGGGIYYAGNIIEAREKRSMQLTNVTVKENEAESKGSGIFIDQGSDVTIFQSFILNNSSYPCLQGGGIYSMSDSKLTIENSQIDRNNSPHAQGGGIYMEAGTRSDLIVRNSTVNENVSKTGGGVYLAGGQAAQFSDCRITGNEAKNDREMSNGGGIANINASLVISNCSVTGNKAANNGGGLYTDQLTRVIIADSVFDDNEAGRGGAIFSYAEAYFDAAVSTDVLQPGLSIERSSVSENKAIMREFNGEYGVPVFETTGRGGGIFNSGDAADDPEDFSLRVVNSTIAKNDAAIRGGGIYNQIHNAFLSHVTITQNGATAGGGVYIESGRFEIGDSIMLANILNDCSGGVYSNGHNVLGLLPGDMCSITRIPPGDVDFSAAGHLAEFGGDKGGIFYMPMEGSVAVGGADLVRCPQADQRGFNRMSCIPAGGTSRCDSGSIQVCCGDGVVGGNEVCDSGPDNGRHNHCNATCSAMVPPTCGNEIIEIRETCDDGNVIDDDGCSTLCAIEVGFICVSPCDVPVAKDKTSCASICTTICGDGNKTNYEACEDGNVTPGDGCNSACLIESCGDGVVQAGLGETCDDKNLVGTDACTDFCQVARCGDRKVQSGVEECDDGNTDTEPCVYGERSCTVCDVTCRNISGAASFCGDGVVNGAETCDSGAENGQAGKCNSDCTGMMPVVQPLPGGGGTTPTDFQPEESGGGDDGGGGGGCSLVIRR